MKDLSKRGHGNLCLCTCRCVSSFDACGANWLECRVQRLIRSDEDIRRAANAWCCDLKTAKTKYGPISEWIMYGVTNTSRLFEGKRNFNSNISRWNVANVTDMNFMFAGAKSFNQPLNSWNVANVSSMSGMFYGASSFNQPLDSWNVANVTDMSCMFEGAKRETQWRR